MKTALLMFFFLSSSCDYRDYPQEQEWREKVKEPVQEMNKEKENDPRKFDEEMEKDQSYREVKADGRENGSEAN